MPINLLGTAPGFGFPTQNVSGTSPGSVGPSALSQLSAWRNRQANAGFPTIPNTQPTQPMGVTAKTPTANVTPAPTTIPSNQQNPPKPQSPMAPSTQSTLPAAPIAPLAQATIQPNQNDPTYNPVTGSSAQNPIQSNSGLLYQAAQNSPTFNSTAGTLANLSLNGSPTAPGYTAQTAQYGAGNIPIGQEAQAIADQYGKKIANVGQTGAQFEAGQLTTGTSPIAEGNAAVTAQTTAAQQQALATGENAALQGINYKLQGQNQAANAANEAAGTANTGQGLLQAGLQEAGGLLQPQLGQPGQAYYNPQTGTAEGSQNGAPAGIDPGVWAKYQQDYATGQFGAIPASILNNAELAGQLQQSTPTGFNYNTATGEAQGQQALAAAPLQGQATGAAATAAAPGQASASNITTAGTAGTAGTAASLQSTIGTYNNMSALNTTADQQAKTVQQVLQSTGLNQGVPEYNKAINSLSGRLGNANVTALTSAVTEMQNVYSQLLSSGGTTPSGSEAQALSLLNPSSTPAQINSAIKQLQTAAYNKLSGQYSQLQTENTALRSGQNTNQGSSSNTGTVQTALGEINTNW